MGKLEKVREARAKLLNAFDQALKEGDWESSLFFKSLGKRLREVRDYIATELDVDDSSLSASNSVLDMEGYTEVYISLYQAEGNNLERWKGTIKALTDFSISRPIYKSEEHVQAMIRSKPDPKREAYVKVFVKDENIIKPYAGKPLVDRFNHELLTLKEGAVKQANISLFVHDGKRYHFIDNELILDKSDAE